MITSMMLEEGLPHGRRRRFAGMKRYIPRNWFTYVGILCGLIVIVTVTVGPTIIGQDPYAIDPMNALAPISPEHWLGTDALGRDVAARIAAGGRVDLLVAFAAVILCSFAAIVAGVITGYSGGAVDTVGTRLVDMFFAIPSLLIALGLVAVMGPSPITIVIAVAIANWPSFTRIIRAEVVNLRSRTYIEASKVVGLHHFSIVTRDLLPGLMPLILVRSTALLGAVMMEAAALGFLGLGLQPPTASWGAILAESRPLILVRPDLLIIACVPILLTVVAVNILTDALNDRVEASRTGGA